MGKNKAAVETVDDTRKRALFLAFGALGVVVCPWIWITLRRNTAASAWNTRPVDPSQSFVSAVSTPVGSAFPSHLEGKIVWVVILAAIIIISYIGVLFQSPGQTLELTFVFSCCWVTGLSLLGFAWLRLGKPHGVRLGLIANFFLHGGICGAVCSFILNSSMHVSWVKLSPDCNLNTMVMTSECNVMAAIMWVITPGLIEETCKSVWLFFRLRRGPEDVPRSCCFCLPSRRGYDCGCWYKLAPTPYHVILCALASGAGFECLENLLFVFVKSGIFAGHSLYEEECVPLAFSWRFFKRRRHVQAPPPLSPRSQMMVTAIARTFTSEMHMIWTGFIGIGLARRLFLPESQRPSLWTILLPSILAHGLIDYALNASTAAAKAQKYMVTRLLLLSSFGIFFGSCIVMALCTGGCGFLCCDDSDVSCCCADGFWEKRFGPFTNTRLEEASLQNTALEAPQTQTMSAMENGGVGEVTAVQPSSFEIGRETLVCCDR